MDPNFFHVVQISRDEDDPYQAFLNYKMVIDGLNQFYKNLHGDDENEA